ncbi:MAG: copper-binding protein [Bacteroidetes bacterium]|nr:copper-binding protein [Bacteroidota bacterium]
MRTLLLLVLLTACAETPPQEADVTGRFEATGVVVRILENSRLIQIRHGDIEGFMPAMTMPFSWREDSVRAAVTVDDSIHFTIATDGVDHWITSATVLD